MKHFYLAHGLGIESAESPFIGTDLGDAYDERQVLAAGMVIVLEPLVWDDGAAGYRSEEVVVVTDDGWISLTDYPYAPYAD
jgi:Xaa-Pro aminopeptidase